MVNERNFRSAPASTLPGSTPRHAPPTKTETKTASIEGRSERARAKNSRDRSEGNVSGARYYGVCENGARTCFSGAREGASEKSGFSAHSLIRSFAPSLSCSRLPAILARDSAGAGAPVGLIVISAPPPPTTTTTTICSCCVSWSAARRVRDEEARAVACAAVGIRGASEPDSTTSTNQWRPVDELLGHPALVFDQHPRPW